jgi:hypothetical protein
MADETTAVETPEEVPTTQNAVQAYAEKQREHRVLAGRLRELDDANLRRILTADEAAEASAIERRLAGMQPQLESLRKAAAHESVTDIVEAYADGVDAAVPEVHAAFDSLMAHLVATKAAYDRLCAIVQRGEQRAVHLPIVMQERLSYPSVPAVQTNLAARLGVDLRMLNEITPARREAARDILPNGRKANRIALQRWLNEHKERLYREAGKGR